MAQGLLIVDDERDMRDLLRALVEGAGLGCGHVGEAGDGAEALDAWNESHPSVVILDHRMPNGTGLEVAETILSEDPAAHIVLLTAYLDGEIQRQAERLGIEACFSKEHLIHIPELISKRGWCAEADSSRPD